MEENKTDDDMQERYSERLNAIAQSVKCVRNDIYTIKIWQMAINFALGLSAIVFLVLSLVGGNSIKLGFFFPGLVLVVAVVVYNIVLRFVAPMSFLQYTAITADKRYCFQIMSKNWSIFSDGENICEVDRAMFKQPESLRFPQYRFDFFTDMQNITRTSSADKEVFSGFMTVDGKRIKCKIVLKDGVLYNAAVNGTRIKYFDVNDSKQKFVVPSSLKESAKAFGIPWPKLQGIHIQERYAKTSVDKQ